MSVRRAAAPSRAGAPTDATEAQAFAAFLAEVRRAVEVELSRLWALKRRRVAKLGPEVGAMVEVAEDLTMRGGKRYRAAMLVAAYEGIVPRRGRALAPAALAGAVALELLQSYLLVQDDWMDGDTERRGGPSAHVALARRLGSDARGASAAMLAGDLLWGMAVEALATAHVPAERRTSALASFCRMHEDVVLGQQLDTMGADCDLEVLHDLKTGAYTTRGPLAVGAALAGADAKALRALTAFAGPVGVAFQLRDDLLGTFASAELAGRPPASDIRSGKRSAVVQAAEPLLSRAAKRSFDAAFGRPGASEATLTKAVAALAATGAREQVHARLEALCSQAERRARSLPLSLRSRVLLVGATSALRLDPALLGAPTAGRSAR